MDRLVQYFVVCGLPSNPKLLDPTRAPDDERARDVMELAVVIGADTEPPEVITSHNSWRALDNAQVGGVC
jgi:hypothetical protein